MMKKIGLVSFLLSMLLHVVFFLVLGKQVKPIEKKENKILVELISIEDKDLKLAEVESQTKEQPDKARFFSNKNNKVKKETVKKKSFSQIVNRAKEDLAKKPMKKLSLQDLSPKNIDFEAVKSGEGVFHKKQDVIKSYKDGNHLNFSEYLDKVKEGEATLLNTKEYKYFSFYSRIKERLEPQWLFLMNTDYKDQIYVGKNSQIKTEITVKINKQGEIVASQISKLSGDKKADLLAQDAFVKLNAFPNPPRGLFENDKEYLYITWGFIIYRD